MSTKKWGTDLIHRSLRKRASSGIEHRLRLELLEDRLAPATFTVRNASGSDVPDSLINCINQANSNPGADTIVFDPTVFGTTAGLTDTITFSDDYLDSGTALPSITDDLTIEGLGSGYLTLQRQSYTSPNFRLIYVGNVALQMIGIRVANGMSDAGAGIYNTGDLTLDRCLLQNNVVVGFSGVTGGAICSTAGSSVSVTNSRFQSNGTDFSSFVYGGAVALLDATGYFENCTFDSNYASIGGAVYLSENSFTFINTTFSYNYAGSTSGGGAIYLNAVSNNSSLTLYHSTIADNSASSGSGGIQTFVYGSGSLDLTLANTLLVNNSEFNFSNAGLAPNFVTLGGNVSDDSSGNFDVKLGDLIDETTIRLGSLSDNGGFVPTRGLLPGSAGINQGVNLPSVTTDARGVTRDQQGIPDSGAYELRPLSLNILGGDGQTAYANAYFSNSLAVQVKEGDRTIEGASVDFSATTPGTVNFGGSESTSVMTYYDGVAYANLDAGPQTGTFTVTASLGSLTTTFTFYVVSPPAFFLVDRLSDDYSDGDFATGHGSLRWALEQANALPGDDLIQIADNLAGTIFLTNGQLYISDTVTIEYLGTTGSLILTPDSGYTSRHFVVDSSATAVIVGLVLENGSSASEEVGYGGSISNSGNLTLDRVILRNNESSTGGAIFNSGSLTLIDSLLEENTTYGSGSGGAIQNSSGTLTLTNTVIRNNTGYGSGGGVFSIYGSVVIVNSYFENNTSDIQTGGGLTVQDGNATIVGSTFAGNTGGLGSAIFLASYVGNMQVSLLNTTISGNTNVGGGSGSLAVYTDGGSLTVDLVHTTIADNHSTLSGGILITVASGSTALTFRNSLFAANDNENIVTGSGSGTMQITSLGNNLSDEVNSFFGSNDLVGVDPQLAPLDDYGGPTPTHLLLPGSPAIDAGDQQAGDPNNDQRDFPRPVGAAPDIGAFESQGYTYTPDNAPQSAVVDQTYSSPLRLRVLEGGQPRSGVSVTFTIPDVANRPFFFGGASSVTVVTDGDGWATTPALIAGTQVMSLDITASVGGSSFAFPVSVTPGAVAGYQFIPPASAFNGETFSLFVRLVDAYGNPHPTGTSAPITFRSFEGTDIVPGAFDFAAHTPDANGYYEVTGFTFYTQGERHLQVEENATPFRTGSTSIHILNEAPSTVVLSPNPTTVNEGQTFTLTGSFTDRGSEIHTIVIDWGDGSTTDRTLQPGETTFQVNHTYTSNLPAGNTVDMPIVVTVRDSLDQSATGNTSVTVVNVAPTLTTGGNGTAYAGAPFTRQGQFSDPGDSNFSITVDYGDGSATQNVSYDSLHQFTLQHTYAGNGSYTVTVQITDGRGGQDTSSFQVIVLTRPSFFLVDRLSDDVTDGDAATGHGSFRYALAQANALPGADIIRFASSLTGTITVTNGAFQINDAVTLENLGTLGSIVFSGAGTRLFQIAKNTTVEMSGLVLQQGNANSEAIPYGGAIYNEGTLTVVNSTLQYNQAQSGGAIYSTGSLNIEDSLLYANFTNGGSGGGIHQEGGFLNIQGTVFSNNTGSGSGGGVFVRNADSFIQTTLFANNSALPGESGGGIRIWNGTATIRQSAFTGNQASFGGGIFIEVQAATNVTIKNTTISGNSAFGGGGALATTAFDALTMTMEFNTIVYNTSSGTGGLFLFGISGTVDAAIWNTLFAGNSNSHVSLVQGGNTSFNVRSLGHNLTDTASAPFDPRLNDLINVDPLLGPLMDNGGPTPTHALLPGSPALSAGLALAGSPQVDQRGQPRPTAGNVINTPDIGAYESNGFTFTQEGDSQRSSAGQTFADLLRLQVLDTDIPLKNAPVLFRLPANFVGSFPGGAREATVQTDAFGWATAPPLLAGTQVTTVVVTAQVGTAVFTYTLFVDPGPVARFEVTGPQSVLPGEMFNLTVRPVDAFGNVFPTGLSTINITSTDLNATFPTSFTFGNDANPDGSYTIFGFTLQTAGRQQILVQQGELIGSLSLDLVNPPPSEFTLAPSTDTVREGQEFTLYGQFRDDGFAEEHTVWIEWGDGIREKVVVPLGQTTFAVPHTYRSNLPAIDPASLGISASVIDGAGQSLSTGTVMMVENDPPRLVVPADLNTFTNVGVEYVRAITFVDAGLSNFMVTVDYGDGTGLQQITVSPNNTILLQHIYQKEGSFLATVRIIDGRGGSDETTLPVDVLFPGIPTDPASRTEVGRNSTGVASAAGVTAMLVRRGPGPETAAIIVAPIPLPVAATLNGSILVGDGRIITTAYDVRAVNVGLEDYVIVQFRYLSTNDELPQLTYRDENGRQKPVSSHLYEVNIARRTITIRLDKTTDPRLQNMRGTVFTISVPITVTPPPAPPSTFTVEAAQTLFPLLNNQRRNEASRDSQAPQGDILSLSALLSGFLVGTTAVQFDNLAESRAVGDEPGQDLGDANSASGTQAEAILGRLPKVSSGVTTLQAVPLTTGNAEPPILEPPTSESKSPTPEEEETNAEQSKETPTKTAPKKEQSDATPQEDQPTAIMDGEPIWISPSWEDAGLLLLFSVVYVAMHHEKPRRRSDLGG